MMTFQRNQMTNTEMKRKHTATTKWCDDTSTKVQYQQGENRNAPNRNHITVHTRHWQPINCKYQIQTFWSGNTIYSTKILRLIMINDDRNRMVHFINPLPHGVENTMDTIDLRNLNYGRYGYAFLLEYTEICKMSSPLKNASHTLIKSFLISFGRCQLVVGGGAIIMLYVIHIYLYTHAICITVLFH